MLYVMFFKVQFIFEKNYLTALVILELRPYGQPGQLPIVV